MLAYDILSLTHYAKGTNTSSNFLSSKVTAPPITQLARGRSDVETKSNWKLLLTMVFQFYLLTRRYPTLFFSFETLLHINLLSSQ